MRPLSAKPLRVCLMVTALVLFPGLTEIAIAQDAAYLSAREAVQKGQLNKVEQLYPQLKQHELAPYVESWMLKPQLSTDSPDIRAFLKKYEGERPAEILRADWIRAQAKQGNWVLVAQQGPQMLQPEPDVQCYSLLPRVNNGDSAAKDQARAIWATSVDTPEACQMLFDAMWANGELKASDGWLRARRQVAMNKPAQARLTLSVMRVNANDAAGGLDAVLGRPVIFLERVGTPNDDTQKELVTLALVRMARNEPTTAVSALKRYGGHLDKTQQEYVWGIIGWQLGIQQSPDALNAVKMSGTALLPDDAMAWRIRVALRAQDWSLVRKDIEAMPEPMLSSPEWVYWLGRAYKAQGRDSAAEEQFQKIAGQSNFYGVLAAEELGGRAKVPAQAKPATPDEIRAVEKQPGIRRALAMYRLDLRPEGVKEWSWALRGMNDRQLLAAAEIAQRNQIIDRSISAADRTKEEHNYKLRFPTPYADKIMPHSDRQNLDKAWVYGLMRQESRFVTNAKSNVGAAGLMQVMPATGKWVANKIGVKLGPGDLHNPDTNVMLGTTYMRLVLESLDNHPVLASAAYNAGPGRARKWRDVKPLEGAIYAETIPFSETRDYVKKVMSNAVFYQTVMTGNTPSLKIMLGTIAPKSGQSDGMPELP
ncbi:MAG: lytic transglycosylase domain-containing protein [Rhodocyclaceae bacterium]|nr:lytic transglycosylase domain-containing protein [Rhodocyclaceae bacterium]